MTLPEIKKVHVVNGGLSTLNLKDDSRVTNRQVVIGTKALVLVILKQPLGFIAKA